MSHMDTEKEIITSAAVSPLSGQWRLPRWLCYSCSLPWRLILLQPLFDMCTVRALVANCSNHILVFFVWSDIIQWKYCCTAFFKATKPTGFGLILAMHSLRNHLPSPSSSSPLWTYHGDAAAPQFYRFLPFQLGRYKCATHVFIAHGLVLCILFIIMYWQVGERLVVYYIAFFVGL